MLSVLRPFQIFPKDDLVISSEMLTVDGSSLDERKHIFMHFQFQAVAVVSYILKEIVLQEQRRPSKHFFTEMNDCKLYSSKLNYIIFLLH